jgi:hypothetical protein
MGVQVCRTSWKLSAREAALWSSVTSLSGQSGACVIFLHIRLYGYAMGGIVRLTWNVSSQLNQLTSVQRVQAEGLRRDVSENVRSAQQPTLAAI